MMQNSFAKSNSGRYKYVFDLLFMFNFLDSGHVHWKVVAVAYKNLLRNYNNEDKLGI